MQGPALDWDHLRSSLDRNAERLAELLRNAPDPNTPVVGLDWTVSELGRHLVTEPERFERFGRGQNHSIPNGDVAAFNTFEMTKIAQDHPRALAELFFDAHRRFAALAAQRSGEDPYTWFEYPMTWAHAAGIYLGELLVHGFDLARTFKRNYEIDRADALRVVSSLVPILPIFVDPEAARGFTGTFELKLRGGDALCLRFEEGSLSVRGGDCRVPDCKISADPVAFLLVGYGRLSQWRVIPQGKMLAYGRKPWLALKFKKLLVNP